MIETGVVKSVDGQDIMVAIKRREACLGCGACSVSSKKEMIIKAKTTKEVKIGDRVTVEIKSASVAKAVVLAYLVPAASFLLGIILALKFLKGLGVDKYSEPISVLAGLFFMGAAFLFLRFYGIKRSDEYQVQVTGIVE